jgi:pimeloyl-ACP methyl ester carboxylesterase
MGTEYLELADGRVAYEVTGPAGGPLVACVHGMGESRRTFRFLAPPLVAAGHRVAAMDVRGYGESTAAWPDYSLESVGADLLALIRHLGGPAIVVGHSIGCAAATWAAAESPADISKLVLISTSSGEDTVKAWMKPAANLVARSATLWGMYYRSLYVSAKPADFGRYVKDMTASLRAPGRLAPLRAQIREALSGVKPRYSEVSCPTLIVMGAKDKDVPDPAADAARVASRLAGPASVTVVPGCGHYPQSEMPDATSTAALNFLAGA